MNKYIWVRKGVHLFAFIIPISYYYFLSKSQFIVFTGMLVMIAGIIELIRFKLPKFRQMFLKWVGKIFWEHEEKFITGATTFVLSAFVCGVVFSKPIVVTGLLFLTFGDTVAYLMGKLGETRIGKRTLYGMFAFFIISIVIVLLVHPEINLLTGIVGAFVACIVEAMPWKIDDNLSIPLISCTIMQILVIFLA